MSIQHHIIGAIIAGKENSCGRKIKYKTIDIADKAASSLNRSKNKRNVCESYYCPFCLKYHIGKEMDLKVLIDIIGKHKIHNNQLYSIQYYKRYDYDDSFIENVSVLNLYRLQDLFREAVKNGYYKLVRNFYTFDFLLENENGDFCLIGIDRFSKNELSNFVYPDLSKNELDWILFFLLNPNYKIENDIISTSDNLLFNIEFKEMPNEKELVKIKNFLEI